MGSDYFEENYRSGYENHNPQKKLKNYIDNIMTYKQEGKLLDIGCAYGTFLKIAEEKAFDVYGIEPTEACNEINFSSGVIHDHFYPGVVPEEWGGFDVITAFDVLEHIPDLDAALSAIDALLNENGLFVMVVPVYDGPVGWGVRMMDKDPTHVWKISRYEWIERIGRYFDIQEKIPHFRINLPYVGYVFRQMQPSCFRFSPAIMLIAKKR